MTAIPTSSSQHPAKNLYHNTERETFIDVTGPVRVGHQAAKSLSVQAAWFDTDQLGLSIWWYRTIRGTPQRPSAVPPRRRVVVSSQDVPPCASPVPSSGAEVRGCDRAVGSRQVARQGMGSASPNLNNDGMDGRFYRQRTEPNFLPQAGRRNVQGGGDSNAGQLITPAGPRYRPWAPTRKTMTTRIVESS